MRISIEKYRLLKLAIIFYFALSFCFFNVLNEYWSLRRYSHYADGISFQNISYSKYFIASLIVIFNAWLINAIKIKDFIYNILCLIFIVLLTPSAILFSISSNIDGRIFFSHNLLFYGILFFSLITIKIPIREFSAKKSFFLLFLITIIGVVPYLRLMPYIDFSNLLLKNIYKTRLLIKENADIYFGYTYGWFNRFIIPALFVFAIYFKNRKLVVFSFLLLVFLYLLGAHKSVLYGTIFVLFTYRLSYLKVISLVFKVVLITILLTYISSRFFNNDIIGVFTLRRAFFTPAVLDFAYFDLFNDNSQYWSEGVLKGITDYKYDRPHPFVIADKYFRLKDMAANNGIVSDGFMNAGLIGVFINVFIVSVYFSIINKLNISSKFFGLFIFLFVSIISSSLTTILLTHGGIVLLFISAFFLKNTHEKLK
ncbi:hypothetical protein [Psychroserpens sp. NJDZ02]|uniref:hypothetical protein n=1 Tax=Psychroserpens sp. NJDZ02 TaxID=2570561 RepID=UPI0010A832D3|nr:hypothetical protein [Psychroserpens sp. NJDZ02]QCE41153.1 hypothetical protein E9099_06885 [Psychroserpens sp. NJDZ02]